jgi:hypothetical protein
MNRKSTTTSALSKILALLVFSITTYICHAQVGYGASGSYYMFSEKQGRFVSLGPILEFGGIAANKYSIRLSYNYFLPAKSSGTTTGFYMGNSTNGQAVNVNYTDRYRIMSVALEAKRYIRDKDDFTEGGFYAGGGFGLLFENVKTTYAAYDSQKYYIRRNDSKVSYNQLMFKAFLGYEVVFDFGTIYLETQGVFPVKSVNAEGSNIREVPVSIAFQLGYRYNVW